MIGAFVGKVHAVREAVPAHSKRERRSRISVC